MFMESAEFSWDAMTRAAYPAQSLPIVSMAESCETFLVESIIIFEFTPNINKHSVVQCDLPCTVRHFAGRQNYIVSFEGVNWKSMPCFIVILRDVTEPLYVVSDYMSTVAYSNVSNKNVSVFRNSSRCIEAIGLNTQIGAVSNFVSLIGISQLSPGDIAQYAGSGHQTKGGNK